MNPDSEQFDQLRKLLTLKRHEQPPPGYFDRFSGEVIARIKAGELQENPGQVWLRRIRSLFEAKPILTGAFGAAVCALVVSGILRADEAEFAGGAFHIGNSGLRPNLGGSLDMMNVGTMADNTRFVSSTNPVSPLVRSLFDQPQINAQPAAAGFGFPSN